MSVEVLKDGIEPPGQNNLTWIFKVRVNGDQPLRWKVDSFDLGSWFKDSIGRYPDHERGDKEEKEDIERNWARFEPRLRAEAEKEVQLGIRVGVDGMRAGVREWSEARSIPEKELPPLNDLQRETAKKLGVPEAEYARSLIAGWRTGEFLLEKAKRLGVLVQRLAQQIAPGAKVNDVVLNTWDERFEVALEFENAVVPLRMKESVVDDLFEGGSAQAEQSLRRVLELSLGVQGRQ